MNVMKGTNKLLREVSLEGDGRGTDLGSWTRERSTE
jgi:hypothetical protein